MTDNPATYQEAVDGGRYFRSLISWSTDAAGVHTDPTGAQFPNFAQYRVDIEQLKSDSGLVLSFSTRSDAELGDTYTKMEILVNGLHYKHDSSGTALTTGDGRTWSPASNEVTLEHFASDTELASDSLAAFDKALAFLPANGGTIKLLKSEYKVSDEIEIGDGTPTSISTKTGIKIVSIAPGGVSEGKSGTPRNGTKILWNGATSDSKSVIRYKGPIHSCELSGVFIDCAGKAGTGLRPTHLHNYTFRDIHVVRYGATGWILDVNDAPLPSGCTYGGGEGRIERCSALDPRTSALATDTATNGILIKGGKTNNVAQSRIVFAGCEFAIGGDSGTYGIGFDFADNHVFYEVFTQYADGSTTSGKGIKSFVHADGYLPGTFPGEVTFYNCPIVGGLEGAPGTLGYIFMPYPTSDGEPIPALDNVRAMTYDGKLHGRWRGASSYFIGRSDPGVGLTSATKYYPPTGLGAGFATDVGGMAMGEDIKIYKLSVELDGSPGTGNTRTFTLNSAGSATAATLTFSEGETGKKEYTSSQGVTIPANNDLSMESSVTGTPSNTNAKWSIEYGIA